MWLSSYGLQITQQLRGVCDSLADIVYIHTVGFMHLNFNKNNNPKPLGLAKVGFDSNINISPIPSYTTVTFKVLVCIPFL